MMDSQQEIFLPNFTFLYPLETSEILKVHLLKYKYTGKKWLNLLIILITIFCVTINLTMRI